jgi:hypothetical protein
LFEGGLGGDGVHYAEGIAQGCAGVHGHGHAEGFGNFFFGSSSLEGCVSVKGDATIAARDDRDSKGDEWRFFPRGETLRN